MRTLTAIVVVWAGFGVAALWVGWRIATIRRRYEDDLDATALVLEEALRIVMVEQSRLNHPSQWGKS